jgi:hypothetical protein
MKKTLDFHKIASKHLVHFGRGVGHCKAELDELETSQIKSLGNWNPDCQESVYSTKIPMKALRVMAGHHKEKGLFFLPRSGLDPPESLCQQIFPFIESVAAIIDRKRYTTLEFLSFLKNIRKVIIQDIACLKRMNREHYLFEHSIFKSSEFNEYCNQLYCYMDTTANPNNASIEAVLPGVQRLISNVQETVSSRFNTLDYKLGVLS